MNYADEKNDACEDEGDDMCEVELDVVGEASAVPVVEKDVTWKTKGGNDRSSGSTTSDSGKARGDASKGKDRPETENDGDYGPGSD